MFSAPNQHGLWLGLLRGASGPMSEKAEASRWHKAWGQGWICRVEGRRWDMHQVRLRDECGESEGPSRPNIGACKQVYRALRSRWHFSPVLSTFLAWRSPLSPPPPVNQQPLAMPHLLNVPSTSIPTGAEQLLGQSRWILPGSLWYEDLMVIKVCQWWLGSGVGDMCVGDKCIQSLAPGWKCQVMLTWAGEAKF
jgi:hypothetical protein